jgi:hypothetical protein
MAAEGLSPGLEGADRRSATGRRTLSSQRFYGTYNEAPGELNFQGVT